MSTFLLRLSLLLLPAGALFVSLSLSPFPQLTAQEQQMVKYDLPANKNEAIFIFDQQNGFMPPRKSKAPVFLLRANGQIEMPELYGAGRDVKGKLTPAEVQKFLHFVIAESKFLEFDANTVQGQIEQIRKTRQIPQIADLPDSIFELNLPGKQQTVRQEAIGMPSEYKEVTAVQNLLAMRRGINTLMGETRVGGKAGITKLLGPINLKLKDQFPDAAPLTENEFRGSYTLQNGNLSATYSRSGKGKDGKPNGTHVTAVVEIPRNADSPSVTLRVKLKP